MRDMQDLRKTRERDVAEFEAAPIIDRMQEVVGVRTDIALGQYFSYGSSTVSGWRTRNKVPYEECMILAKRKGVSLDWLLLGTGSIHGDTAPAPITEGSSNDPRMQRIGGFLLHWTATHNEDEKAWLEMQLARAVPEYAEWVASRGK
jgi:hypothetical protein